MSHTGTVIQEDLSPGLIRIITTGVTVSSERLDVPSKGFDVKPNSLVFRKPKVILKRKNVTVDHVRERFVIYISLTEPAYSTSNMETPFVLI